MSGILGGSKPKSAPAPAPAPAPVTIIVPQADPEELERQRRRDLARRAGGRQATTGLSDDGSGDTLG